MLDEISEAGPLGFYHNPIGGKMPPESTVALLYDNCIALKSGLEMFTRFSVMFCTLIRFHPLQTSLGPNRSVKMVVTVFRMACTAETAKMMNNTPEIFTNSAVRLRGGAQGDLVARKQTCAGHRVSSPPGKTDTQDVTASETAVTTP
jgi:hypothetical protein